MEGQQQLNEEKEEILRMLRRWQDRETSPVVRRAWADDIGEEHEKQEELEEESVEKELEAQACRPKRSLRMQVPSSIPTTLLNSRGSLTRYPSLDQWPVARDSQACIFYDSKHAASICLGTIQSRANVPLGLTLQPQSRLRITMQHICIKKRRSKDEISILLDSLLGTQCSQMISLLQSDPGTLRRDLRRSHDARQMY